MTVREYIDKYFTKYHVRKIIRMMDFATRKGLHKHWIDFENHIVRETKVTKDYIFIFI